MKTRLLRFLALDVVIAVVIPIFGVIDNATDGDWLFVGLWAFIAVLGVCLGLAPKAKAAAVTASKLRAALLAELPGLPDVDGVARRVAERLVGNARTGADQ